ncbi:MAG: 30S ribosomal protein S12 methylthiotransferase RimO [Chitinispirillaceae bacterium]|jgi:ribosomal protein S12 methylthiotransferase|nr:30S ribosomal protein S12 methylthiotransferase RimO [Chitinispirillaceae bacterium]
MPSVAITNLGCAKNQIDGERIMTLFTSAGYALIDDCMAADIVVVNTCAFIREAKEEAIDAIIQATLCKKKGRCRTLVVSGCFSQRYRDEVRNEFPEVDLWTGVADWESVLRSLIIVPAQEHSSFKRELPAPLHTQYIKIAEGCTHGCSYCAIPLIRGKFRSRPVNDIITEARWLEAQGVRELILVAQDSSFYGNDLNTTLARLIETLLAKTKIPWLRIMYLHPGHVDNALLQLVASEKRICPYFDMPLQHIADPILKAMNRPSASRTRMLIENIRKTVPDASLRSAFILGFPGETEAHFNELVRFVEETRFDKLGVFSFSPEEGTRAHEMRPRPRLSTAARRGEMLMEIQSDISRSLLARKIGASLDVMVDGAADHRPGRVGRTRFDAPDIDGRVFIRKSNAASGAIVNVTITGSDDYDLFADPG